MFFDRLFNRSWSWSRLMKVVKTSWFRLKIYYQKWKSLLKIRQSSKIFLKMENGKFFYLDDAWLNKKKNWMGKVITKMAMGKVMKLRQTNLLSALFGFSFFHPISKYPFLGRNFTFFQVSQFTSFAPPVQPAWIELRGCKYWCVLCWCLKCVFRGVQLFTPVLPLFRRKFPVFQVLRDLPVPFHLYTSHSPHKMT